MKRALFFLATIALFTACVEETDPNNAREDFLGNWTCTEYEGDFAPQTYNVEVTPFGSDNQVLISGLYNFGPTFILGGTVSGKTLNIEYQLVSGVSISGYGNINLNLDRVDVTFTANDGGGADNVRAYWLR